MASRKSHHVEHTEPVEPPRLAQDDLDFLRIFCASSQRATELIEKLAPGKRSDLPPEPNPEETE